MTTPGWVDIHCHLLPNIDDGARDEAESLAMARMAVADGTATVICTPHQLGNYRCNTGSDIRRRVELLQQRLNAERIPLVVLPGGDVRIEDDLSACLASGEVLTLGDHGKHVLLELPHEIYFPIEPVLDALSKQGMVGILSHPERNRGILRRPEVLEPLVERGCLMQVTAGSLTGAFGPEVEQLAERIVTSGWAHFLASDAHGPKKRRPLVNHAFERAAHLVGEAAALAMCCENPRLVAEGKDVPGGWMPVATKSKGWWFWKRVS